MTLYGEGVATPFPRTDFPRAAEHTLKEAVPSALHEEEAALLSLPTHEGIPTRIEEERTYTGILPETVHVTQKSSIIATLTRDTLIHCEAHCMLLLTIPENTRATLTLILTDTVFAHGLIRIQKNARITTRVRGVSTGLLDTDIRHVHEGEKSMSLLDMRILTLRGKSILQGLVKILPGSKESEGYQELQAYHVDGIVQSLPNLEIGDHEVKCTHGASTRTLHGENIFYLQSRGLEEKEALMLDAESFLLEHTPTRVHDTLREKIRTSIQSWKRVNPA